MRRRTLVAPTVALTVGLTVALLTGCGTAVTPAERAAQCSALAADVLAAELGPQGPPTAAGAKTAADRLDGRLTRLTDPAVHDAGVALHTHLHGLQAALEDGDDDRVAALTRQVREDVELAARTCELPATAFLGG